MPSSSRFAVALHVVTLLAAGGGRPVPSALVAGSVRTNPVVIRRILRDLARAGIVETRRGSSGGSRLARAPRRVTLLQVYRAVEEEGALLALPGHRRRPRPRGRPVVASRQSAIVPRPISRTPPDTRTAPSSSTSSLRREGRPR